MTARGAVRQSLRPAPSGLDTFRPQARLLTWRPRGAAPSRAAQAIARVRALLQSVSLHALVLSDGETRHLLDAAEREFECGLLAQASGRHVEAEGYFSNALRMLVAVDGRLA